MATVNDVTDGKLLMYCVLLCSQVAVKPGLEPRGYDKY